jgi:prepilin-type N-terminal cleavage/methylation domain-containing protein
MSGPLAGERGFTLVEAIVTIVIAAIMGVIFAQLMGTAMSRSVQSVENVRRESAAEALADRILADYLAEINRADPSGALGVIKGRDYGTEVVKRYIRFTGAGAEDPTHNPDTPSDTLKVTVKAIGSDLTLLLANSRTGVASPPVPF